MKVLFVILDGLGDRQYPELDGMTPLEAARTQNMDALAADGVTGLMYPFQPGVAPSSDLAHFRLFGFPRNKFPGRGYLEALGENVPIGEDEVVFRTSFLKVARDSDGFTVSAREIEGEDTAGKLAAAKIKDTSIDGVDCRFVYTGARQGLLIMSGNVSPEVTDSDPLAVGLPIGEVEAVEEAKDKTGAANTAAAANAFMLRAAESLEELPLDFLALKWAGRRTDIKTFTDITSMRGAIVAEGALYKGIAGALGMEFVQGSPGSPKDSLNAGLDKAESLFRAGVDFVHVHSKAPDQAGHKKDPINKRNVIEELDDALSGVRGGDERLVVITGDHATPSAGPQIHSGEAVPILMAGGRAGRDSIDSFGDSYCRAGMLGTIRGRDVMPLILNYTDRANYLGLRPYAYRTAARPTGNRTSRLKP